MQYLTIKRLRLWIHCFSNTFWQMSFHFLTLQQASSKHVHQLQSYYYGNFSQFYLRLFFALIRVANKLNSESNTLDSFRNGWREFFRLPGKSSRKNCTRYKYANWWISTYIPQKNGAFLPAELQRRKNRIQIYDKCDFFDMLWINLRNTLKNVPNGWYEADFFLLTLALTPVARYKNSLQICERRR